MLRKHYYLLLALICLSPVACGTLDVGLDVGRQQEPATGQTGATRSATVIAVEKEVTPPATGIPEPTPAGTGVDAATGTTETEAIVEGGLHGTAEASDAFGDGIYAQKMGETVVLPACYDFDDGASVVPPDPACDFSLLPGPDDGTIEVYPQAGAQLAYGGVFAETPTPAQCATSDALSGEREIVAPMAAMYLCYRTGAGRTGYLHFTAANVEQAGSLTLDWVTFAGESGAGGNGDREALTYRNDTFGFWLTLPPTWNGFQTTGHTAAENHLPDVGSVCFTFAGHTPFCILKIDVWSLAAWSRLELIPDGYYLGENSQFVFAAGPYTPECVQLDSFQCERRQEVPSILAGFSFDTE